MVSEQSQLTLISMASSCSNQASEITLNQTSTITLNLPNFNQMVKLECHNYLMWLSQVLPALRSQDILGFVDGSEPCPPQLITDDEGQEITNPTYLIWTKKDQLLLSWINVTLSDKVLSTVYGLDTSRLVWAALANRFASQSRSRIAHLKRQLQTLKQGSKTCSKFLQTAKMWSDQLATVGKPLDDEDIINFIIGGLNPSFNTFVTSYSLTNRDLNFDDFQNELLNHEMMMQQQQIAAPDATTFALFSQKQGQGH
jgi:hypothetical protein